MNILVRGRSRDGVERAAAVVSECIGRHAPPSLRLLGPALAPLERVRYQWRAQLLLRTISRVITQLPNRISVTGHTSAAPGGTSFESRTIGVFPIPANAPSRFTMDEP